MTGNVLGSGTDQLLEFVVPGFGRSIGDLSWHITTALQEIGGRAGLRVNGPGRRTPRPESVEEIVDAYHYAAVNVQRSAGGWRDEDLLRTVDVYGEQWTAGRTLHVMVGHEIHHRGQLTVLLRAAGRPVPETYGPTGTPPIP